MDSRYQVELKIRKPAQDSGGWMHMMCWLDAYLEYAINLLAAARPHMPPNLAAQS
jgi:hypothetical protein